MAKKSPQIAELARKAVRAQALGKKHYAEADRLVNLIAQNNKPGTVIELEPEKENGAALELVDNFEGRTIVWGHGGVRKYSLEPVKR